MIPCVQFSQGSSVVVPHLYLDSTFPIPTGFNINMVPNVTMPKGLMFPLAWGKVWGQRVHRPLGKYYTLELTLQPRHVIYFFPHFSD